MGELRDVTPYPYMNPAALEHTLFWHIRARREDGSKTFWYVTADKLATSIYSWRAGTKGKPNGADRCLYRLPELRKVLRRQVPVILWTEGEKDAETAIRAYRVPATSHHGGAGKTTREQAAHFRGYRGTVLVVADRDDPGLACAYRRWRLLDRLGVRAEIKEPAVYDLQIAGADLTDHADAGAGLDDR